METMETYAARMEHQLKQWGAKLDALAEKVKEAGADARADERKLVAELKAKREGVQAKLADLKAAGVDKWETFKTGVDGVYDELERAFKKLKN